MLTFDLKQLPPSVEEIESEREYLERELAKNKRRHILMIVLFFLIPIAAIVASWQFGLVDGKTAVVIAVGGGGGGGAAAGGGAGAVVGAVIGVAAGAGGDAIISEERESEIREQISSLSFLDEVPNQARCPQILEICKVDEG